MKKKIGVLRFLGTNCDRDIIQAVKEVGRIPEFLWYQNQFDFNNYDALVIPGGFSYGDYLRTGAMSAIAPAMKSVREANDNGMPILGVCNGFQILCETRMLPGALMRNVGIQFIDEWCELEVQNNDNPWTNSYSAKQKITLPIAHGEGCYYASTETLKKLQDKNQIIATYKNNPNGSCYDIAAVMNEKKNIVGLMPHPERAMFDWTGGKEGRGFFEWLS